MVKLIIAQALLVTLLGVPSNATTVPNFEEDKNVLTIVEPSYKHPIAKVYTKRNIFTAVKEFLQFKVLGKVNTNISLALKVALTEYQGPEVSITSLKRSWNNKSAHNHGNAVDFEFDGELIKWLVSTDGQAWLERHNLMFYIEDKPGSKILTPYKTDPLYAKFVFENPNATGDHIHIAIKKV